jgi:hypothetical protein
MLRDSAVGSVRAALVAGLVAVAVGPSPVAAQGLAPEVREVEFVGNVTFPPDSLKRAIVTAQTECRSGIMRVLGFCSAFG